MTNTKTLKAVIQKEFPELTDQYFDAHESDLYVQWVPGLRHFLRHNLGLPSIQTFMDDIDGLAWLDIAFMNDNFWDRFNYL